MELHEKLVSVPIRGLFNLTIKNEFTNSKNTRRYVSVPIRGLFNLTILNPGEQRIHHHIGVSVPIRGLFNLTTANNRGYHMKLIRRFRPHQGII